MWFLVNQRPKYFRYGRIAWFIDEGVIRCVGDKCFKNMDPEGYELAMRQLNAEIEAERTIDFLFTRIPRIRGYVRLLESDLPALEALDAMLNRLLPVLDKTFAIDLWPHVDGGTLRYIIQRREIRRGPGGEEEVHTFADFEDYGAISCYIALRPRQSRLAPRLRARIHNLQTVDFWADALARVTSITEPEKKAAVKILTWAHKDAKEICGEAVEVCGFFTPETLATINGWSERGEMVAVHFAMNDKGFHLARHSSEPHTLFRWPEHLWKTVRQLEPLSRPEAA
jgi:hypothetical protein